MNLPRLIFIVGTTASGKSDLALEEARKNRGAVLSCDSLCVYRGMDIGTAKPTWADQEAVPHYGLDLSDPEEPYSVCRYVAYRDRILNEHQDRRMPLFVVGGSGFYLKSFFTPVMDRIVISPEIKARVEAIRSHEGLSGLTRELERLHGARESFPGLDMDNPRRVEKALMRCLASGQSYRELLEAFKSLPDPVPGWRKEVWLVARSSAELQARNERRVGRMLKAGLIDEVRRLRARGFERNPSACGAIGYREVLAFLDNPTSEQDLAEAIVTHTRQLMRRQKTWFRHQIPVTRDVHLRGTY